METNNNTTEPPAPVDYQLTQRACKALTQAFCELRHYSKRPLNDQGKDHLFRVADAAHNIPSALAGNEFFASRLEDDVKALEESLGKMRDCDGDRQFFMGQPNKKPSVLSQILMLNEAELPSVLISILALAGLAAGLFVNFTR